MCLLLPFGRSGQCLGQGNILSRTYHDVTARDNGYFNANLDIQETRQKLWDGQKDNFEEVLPVFKYGVEGEGKSVAGAMDEVIKKCSFPIQLHKGSKWVDDAYFLVGQAYFYKEDYDNALQSFQYLISEYEDIDAPRKKTGGSKKKKRKRNQRNKKKAEDELPSRDKSFAFLYHHKRSPEAALWIARTLVQLDRTSDAQTALSVIRGNEEFPEALRGELEAVQAHLILRQGKLEQAVAPIRAAIDATKPKLERARYTFILAQLYARIGRPKDAIETYEAVLKLRPDYEMEFFAQINMANILRDNKLRSGSEIKKLLADLLKDEKNREYFGLIYYAMADIDLEGGDEEEGIKNLNLAIRNGDPDPAQQALAYLRLADLNYDTQTFEPAYYYYDSCLTALPPVHARFKEAEARRDGLEGLVEYLKTIETEERLQAWAKLPEKARTAEIEEWLLETRGPIEDEDDSDDDPFFANQDRGRTNAAPVAGNGKRYFYDEARRGAGFSTFRQRWGKRANEDNWRRSNKRSISLQVDDENTADGGGKEDNTGPLDLDNLDIALDDILSGLPIDSAGKASSDSRISNALYEVALIYKDYFKNTEKATAYFKELLQRYPQTEHRLPTAYHLYRLLSPPANEPYKRIVLDEFPESLFAKVIEDPDYFDRLERKDEAVKNYYAATFDMFEAERYDDVLERVSKVDSQFAENPIKAHFDLLGAMVFGERDSMDAFLAALQDVVNTHPGTEQAVRAQELLNHLRLGSVIQRAEEAKLESDYDLVPNVEHFVALVVFQTGREAANVKTKLSDFNREFFSMDNLRVSSLLFESDKTIVLVKTFSNLDKAMKYYRDLRSEEEIMGNLPEEGYELIAVSRTNYTSLYRKKDLDGYIDFFKRFYLIDN